jgi:hypothetical protein
MIALSLFSSKFFSPKMNYFPRTIRGLTNKAFTTALAIGVPLAVGRALYGQLNRQDKKAQQSARATLG